VKADLEPKMKHELRRDTVLHTQQMASRRGRNVALLVALAIIVVVLVSTLSLASHSSPATRATE